MESAAASLPEPPNGSLRLHHNHNRDLALQKYALLQEEHDHLRQHLDSVPKSSYGPTKSIRPTLSSNSSIKSYSPSASCWKRRSSLPAGPSQSAASNLPPCLEPVIDVSTIAELSAEEAQLCHVNETIKRVLTELLNCEAVREDRALRTWVQCRLMDTEKELRTGRRRRSAPESCLDV